MIAIGGFDFISVILGGLTAAGNAFLRFLSSYLIQVIGTSPLATLPPILLGPSLPANAIGVAEYISISLTMFMVMVATVWHKQIKAALKAFVASLVIIGIGGGFFYIFLDELQALSASWVQELLAHNKIDFITVITGSGISDAVAALAGTAMASWYTAYIVVFLYVLVLLLVLCRLIFIPLVVLATVSEKAKWLLDWTITVMLFGTIFGPPLLIGEILLGLALNAALGPSSGFLAIVALVAALALARHTLTNMLKATNRSIAKVTNNLKVRGRVKNDDRPKNVDAKAATEQAAATQRPVERTKPSLPRKIGHAVASEGALALAVKLGAMPATMPVKVATTVAMTLHGHLRNKAGVKSNAPSNGGAVSKGWEFLRDHHARSAPNGSPGAAPQLPHGPNGYGPAPVTAPSNRLPYPGNQWRPPATPPPVPSYRPDYRQSPNPPVGAPPVRPTQRHNPGGSDRP
jgi:hypothetical protein